MISKIVPFHRRDHNKVLLAIPLKENMRWQTLWSMTRIPQLSQYEFTMIPFGGGDVCHSRNLAFHYWRTRTDCGRIQFIDADLDLFYQPDCMANLLRWNRPVVCGIYPLSDSYLRWSFQGWCKKSADEPKLLDVEECCTGLMQIRYDVLERLIRTEDEFVIEDAEYRGEVGHEVTKMCLVDRRRYSEDFYLSKLFHDARYEVNVDPTAYADHVKTIGLLKRFSPGEIAASLVNPTQM